MNVPKVTVAIPTCCDRARYVGEAIESVLGQTLDDIEVFVSNNGSTDETASLVASIDDPRLHYVELPEPGGMHLNFNNCLGLGTAPFVALCQDDDYWFPHNLERLLEAMERHPNVGLAHAAFHMVDSDGRVLREQVSWTRSTRDTVEPGSVFIRRSMSNVNEVNMSSALMRRTVLAGESFDPADDVLCDTGMWLRLARRGDVAFLTEPLTALRVNPESSSVREGINDALRRTTLHEIRLAQRVKRRFLAQFGYLGTEQQELQELARQWARHELLNIVVRTTSPVRSPVGTLRGLGEAIRIEPSLLRTVRTWRVFLASMVGSRGRRLARRVVGRARQMDLG